MIPVRKEPNYYPFGLTGYPKAYLNWIFLDDQFNYVSSLSGAVQAASSINPAGTLNTVAPGSPLITTKNGYLYIWVSNETQGWDVFFDNLSVQHNQGPILEETHYYPFGLTMAGISDKAIKTDYAENKYRYNDKELQNKEFSDGTGLEEYDYGARFQDPQIGRFTTQSKFSKKYYSLSPYQYAANNPVKNIDINGDSIFVQIMVDAKTRETQNFYYGQVDGKYGLVGSDGKLNTGTSGDFGNQIAGALDQIRTGGDFGAKFIGDLATGRDNVEVRPTTGDNKTQDGILYVNPSADQSAPTEKGSQKLPFEITLGHELAHGLANVQGVSSKDWVTIPTADGDRTLSQSEIYATHIENNLRAEQGLPLRTHYSQDADGNPVSDTRILDSKYRSLYFKNGDTSPRNISYPKTVPADDRYIYRKPK